MDKQLLQNNLEQLFNKNQIIPRMTEEFKKEKAIQEMIEKSKLNEDFCYSLLVQMSLHRRCNLPTLIGLLRHYFDDSQQTVDAIGIAALSNLVEYNHDLRVFITIATMTAQVQAEIDKFCFPLPLVIEPKKLKTNNETGYHMLTKGSVILKNNHHTDDVCLDHLNRVNKTKLSINQRVMFFIQNQWRNLDKPKEGETAQDYNKRVKAFNKFDTSSREILALLIKTDNEFYLTHKYDKRGRVYPVAYQVNYQGNPWCKAICEFNNQEII